MDPELDPQVQHAVAHPAQTARGPEDVQLHVRLAGEPARRALGAHWEDAAADNVPGEDRFAAAVLLATLFGDTFWLERAARLPGDVPGCPSAPPSGLLELTRVPGARAAMAAVLERPVLTGLLEWGTDPLPEQPPLAVARAARDLSIPDDGRVYRVVRRRAERFLAREHDGSEPLERFVALLAEAENGYREDGPVRSGEALPPAAFPAPPALGDAPSGLPPSGPSIADAPEAPQWGVSPSTPAPPPPGQLGRAGEPGEPYPGQAQGAPFPGAAGPGAGAGGRPPRPAPGPEEDDSDNLKAWGLVFLAIVAVIVALIFVL